MKKTTYRSLVYTIALAATVSGIPHCGYAADGEPIKEAMTALPENMGNVEAHKGDPAAVDALTKPVPHDAAIMDHKVEEQISGLTPEKKTVDETSVDPKTEQWMQSRPEEKAISEYMQPLEGLTIVDVQFEGASEKTFPTVQQAVAQHAGDVFSVAMAEKDRASIYNTGYFYDLYPTFEQVPEGVVITYHLLFWQMSFLSEIQWRRLPIFRSLSQCRVEKFSTAHCCMTTLRPSRSSIGRMVTFSRRLWI